MRSTDPAVDYDEKFASHYDELVDWHRREAEHAFLARLLRDQGCQSVLDVAAGTGHHAVALAKEGFDVVATDGSPAMAGKAAQLVRQQKVAVTVTVADWLQLGKCGLGRADAVLCLGNSFSHLLNEKDRRQVMKAFRSMLNENGIVVVDYRNYGDMVTNGSEELPDNYYCNNAISVVPKKIHTGHVELSYKFPDGYVHSLIMYPLDQDEMVALMQRVGIATVETYDNYGIPAGDLPAACYVGVGYLDGPRHPGSPAQASMVCGTGARG